MRFTNIDKLINHFPQYNIWDEPANSKRLENLKRYLPKALKYLTPRQALYIQHMFFDEMKNKEIAELYDVNPSTVTRTIQRGLKRIKEHLEFSL